MQQQGLLGQSPSAPVIAQPGAAPLTAQDVQAYRVRLNDLRNEPQDAAERRNSIAGRLREADIDARPGYQARLQTLDNRILSIENEITSIVARMGSAPPSALVAGTREVVQNPGFQMGPDTIIPVVALISIFVFLPLSIGISRFLWRRAQAPPRAAVTDHATQQRLEQLQQSVDSIAIEVERISEGQRFVTKILGDRERPAVGPGAAESVRASQKSALPTDRG
jgi:hypothetical protein